MIIAQKSLRDGNVNTRKVLKQTTVKDNTVHQKNRASNSIYRRSIVNQSFIKRLRPNLLVRSIVSYLHFQHCYFLIARYKAMLDQ